MNETAQMERFSLTPKSLDEAIRFAEVLSKSNIVPKEFAGNPGNILVAIQWGLELGLQPMQAMQNIAVINGRPSLWGDSVIGLVRASPLCEYIYETDDGETATCRVKRRGEEEQVRTFGTSDARTAGLAEKSGTWKQYPKRMRQMRARAFALRDVFPDVLRGMSIAEEVMDVPAERDMGPAHATASTMSVPVRLPNYTDDQLELHVSDWRDMIDSGKATADRIVAMASSRYTLTPEQIQRIRDLEKPAADAFVAEMNEEAAQ